jgi:hypothetical protein
VSPVLQPHPVGRPPRQQDHHRTVRQTRIP